MYQNLPNGHMPVMLLNGNMYVVMGGPYLAKPDHFCGVKMAAEIDAPCTIDIPTRDFGVPDSTQLVRGLAEGVVRMIKGYHLYIGCMGGIGRTGLYMAGLAKIMHETGQIKEHPIQYVREHYLSRAVETPAQELFIENLDVSSICFWLEKQAAINCTIEVEAVK